ncbi:MAG TPA: bifunctional 5,10-methylenetetrahydrofolate dehydrogenase/5,10-methenyltetrahydrofolate cyclohydrolase [Gaiellaceae bacterium]|jgi:methylenetetrahydrofolate dehydrogenase (NADP+)/methenyltetrahydrofolate cyclohydrolase|nr:bifunctional 5,10-methylenetetrahydrofolate dehydrogenase/5,10-methenyltetrahydrofolate cyclohydrolase [Gaiellaceae bacterium]
MTLLEGRALAAGIRERAAAEAAAGPAPVLAAVTATDDPATAWYLGSIAKAAAATGIELREERCADAAGVLERLDALSADPGVHGIICLTPLPDGLSLSLAGERIAPAKDIDGASPASLGRLAAGLEAYAPATAQAVIELIRISGTNLEGAHAVVVGRSTVVGKPLAMLLLAEQATVTICHTRTRDLAGETRRADVLVAAAGRAHLIGAEHVAPGALVIDVGTNEASDGSMVGDVDTAAVEPIAAAVTPVPGGVGPVTTAILLRNAVAAARG